VSARSRWRRGVSAVASKPSLQRSEWQLGAKAQFASPIADFCNKIGTSRHFVAMQQFSRFLSEADIQRAAIAEPDL